MYVIETLNVQFLPNWEIKLDIDTKFLWIKWLIQSCITQQCSLVGATGEIWTSSPFTIAATWTVSYITTSNA